MIEILHGIPLPPKRQKHQEPVITEPKEPLTVSKEFVETHYGYFTAMRRLSDGSLKYHVSIARYKRGERIL